MGDRRQMALGVLCLLLVGVVVYDRLPRRTEAVSQPIAKPNPPEFVTKLVLMPEEVNFIRHVARDSRHSLQEVVDLVEAGVSRSHVNQTKYFRAAEEFVLKSEDCFEALKLYNELESVDRNAVLR